MNYVITTRNASAAISPQLNKNKKKDGMLLKYHAKTHMSDGNVGCIQLNTPSHIHTCGRTKQVRIFITTTSGKRWKKAGWDLNVSGMGEIAASTRIMTVLSPSMVARGLDDGWYRSKRSKNLENVAERVKSR